MIQHQWSRGSHVHKLSNCHVIIRSCIKPSITPALPLPPHSNHFITDKEVQDVIHFHRSTSLHCSMIVNFKIYSLTCETFQPHISPISHDKIIKLDDQAVHGMVLTSKKIKSKQNFNLKVGLIHDVGWFGCRIENDSTQTQYTYISYAIYDG